MALRCLTSSPGACIRRRYITSLMCTTLGAVLREVHPQVPVLVAALRRERVAPAAVAARARVRRISAVIAYSLVYAIRYGSQPVRAPRG